MISNLKLSVAMCSMEGLTNIHCRFSYTPTSVAISIFFKFFPLFFEFHDSIENLCYKKSSYKNCYFFFKPVKHGTWKLLLKKSRTFFRILFIWKTIESFRIIFLLFSKGDIANMTLMNESINFY